MNSNTANVIPFAPAPAVSTPSISASAMLVELSISCWTGRKLDKRASNEVTDDKNAKRGVANVNKKLLGDCPELENVVKYAASCRTQSYASTMPWSDAGLRLLPTTAYFTYHAEMTKMQGEFWGLVETFLQAYDWEKGQAQLRLGELFNPGEYPTADTIRGKFAFNINYMPVPETSDWRVSIGDDAKDALTKTYDSYYRKQLEGAMRSVWERAYDALKRMSERLDYDADGEKKVFRDSLVHNVQDIVVLMETCNITNDADMTRAQEELKRTLHGVTPEALRNGHELRRRTKAAVDSIIATLPGLGM